MIVWETIFYILKLTINFNIYTSHLYNASIINIIKDLYNFYIILFVKNFEKRKY